MQVTVPFVGGPICGLERPVSVDGAGYPTPTCHITQDGRKYSYVRRRGLHGNWYYQMAMER